MLQKLKRALFGGQAADQLDGSALRDSRIHPRYNLESFSFLRFQDSEGRRLKIRDLSYGGLSFSKLEFSSKEFSGSEIRGDLQLFDQSCPIFAKKVHDDSEQIGFQFVHDDAHVLMFLRALLEDLRCGSTLTLLNPDLVKASYQHSYNFILRGDGPIDLLLDYSNDSLHTALATLRSNHEYLEVRWQRDLLQTGRVVDEPGLAPRMLTDKSLNQETLRKTIRTLAGFMMSSRTELHGLTAFYKIIEANLA